MKRAKPVTIYDVARLAGVSSSTVSRVVNGKRVDAEMTERVQRAVRDTGYQLNQLARGLYTQQSRMIGCLLPDISNPYFATLFMAVERQALARGYTLLLCNGLDDLEVEAHNLQVMSERQVDAVILTGGRINELSPSAALVEDTRRVQRRTPLVQVNGDMPGLDSARVQVDEVAGVRAASGHLLALGHRRIAFLGGLQNVRATHEKRAAFTEELRGVGSAPGLTLDGGYTLSDVAEMMHALLRLPRAERPSAVLCINDAVAAGAAHAAAGAGLSIPRDLSVVGFDDTALAATFWPPLTTVSHRYALLAELVLDAALNAMQGEQPHLTLAPELIVRGSTAAPPAP